MNDLPKRSAGQVWLTRVDRPAQGGEKKLEYYLVLLQLPPREWDIDGLVRSSLKHGNLENYSQADAADNMKVLRTTKLRRHDWSKDVDFHHGSRLHYISQIGQWP